MFPPLVSPVFPCFVPAVLSTRQTPAVLPRSRKRLVSPGAGHGPGPPLHGRVSLCRKRQTAAYIEDLTFGNDKWHLKSGAHGLYPLERSTAASPYTSEPA